MKPSRLLICAALLCFCVPWQLLTAAEPQRLTSDGRLKYDPVFVNGGKAIVYNVEQTGNQWVLTRLDLESGKSEAVHPSAASSEVSVSYSRDEQWFAFALNDANLHSRLVQVGGPENARLEYNPGGGFAGVRYVTLAPDASRLVFAFAERGEGSQQLWSIDMRTKEKRPLTLGEGFDACPRFSPDGRSLAFTSTREGNFDIYVMEVASGVLQRVTDHAGLDTRPSWSPDGRRLAFTSLRDGNYEVYTVAVDGTELRRVTTNEERDDFAWWHPDGKRLVVVSEREGRHDLYLVDTAN